MGRLRFPTLLGFAHGASDAAAGFLVVMALTRTGSDAGLLVLFYNAVAFGLQPLTGLLLDRFQFAQRASAAALVFSALGLSLSQINLPAGILCVGLGSAFFHPGAGGLTLVETPGRSDGPAVFAAFGVVGLAVGTQAALDDPPASLFLLLAVLLLLAIGIWVFKRERRSNHPANFERGFPIPDAWTLIFILGLALRSFVWTASKTGISDASLTAMWVACAAGSGKFFGGFIADRVGWRAWTGFALLACVPLLVFRDFHPTLLLAGVFLLQSVTGPSLAWLGQRMPATPSMAAGIGLGLAVIIGGVPFLFAGAQQTSSTVIIITFALVSTFLHWLPLKIMPA